MIANKIIEVTTWRNSTHNNTTGAGYGIRIPKSEYSYIENWNKIIISNTEDIVFRESRSFNKKCPEIRSKLIGKFLISNNLNNWQKGETIKLNLEDLGHNIFRLYF